MRRLSDDAPVESPVIEIRERQWMIRNWLLGGLVAAVLILSGLIVAGIRVNEIREQRTRALASGQSGKLVSDLRDAIRMMDERTTDARIAGVATAVAKQQIAAAAAGDRLTYLSRNLSAIEEGQKAQSEMIAGLQSCGERMKAENEALRAELTLSRSLIAALESQRLADSLALAERTASLDRRIRSMDDQTSSVDKRVGQSNSVLRGVGGLTVANLAVSVIHLLGTKQTTDVGPTSTPNR
jgi:hypothetical protein